MQGDEQSRVREIAELSGEGWPVRRQQERCGSDLSFARAARVVSEKEWQPC